MPGAPARPTLGRMITVENLTKTYGGFTAVDGVCFTARPGRVTGFLGPNGAGKSTTMRIVVGLTPPTHGAALIGTRPGHVMVWVSPGGTMQRLEVIKVANGGNRPDPGHDPGPQAA